MNKKVVESYGFARQFGLCRFHRFRSLRRISFLLGKRGAAAGPMTSRQSDFDVMKNTKVPVEKWELFKLAIGRLCCVDFVGRVGSFALSEQDSATASGARLLRLEDVALVDPPA